MDSPSRRPEPPQCDVEFLAALTAFQECQIDAECLRAATELYLTGEYPSLCDALAAVDEAAEKAVLEQFPSAHVCLTSQMRARSRRRALEQQQAQHFQSQVAVPASEFAEEILVEPSDEVPDPGIFLAHLYYIDDMARSLTAGWMGWRSFVALSLAVLSLATAAWVIPSQDHPLPQSFSQPTPSKALNIAAEEVANSNADSASGETLEPGDNSVLLASKREPQPAEEVPPPDSPPAPELDPTPILNMESVSRFIAVADLESAIALVDEQGTREPALQQLAIGLLLEQGTTASLLDASARFQQLDLIQDPFAQLQFTRWAMAASPQQRSIALEELRLRYKNELPTLWLASLCGDHQLATVGLQKAIADGDQQLSNRLFLAIAQYYSGNRRAALRQLELVEESLNSLTIPCPKLGEAAHEAEIWLSDATVNAIGQGVAKLRGRLEIPN